ncbi:MAG: hypothetical protein AAGF01_32180 [Cyanobacteria bacterium P01_G01_bin.38]
MRPLSVSELKQRDDINLSWVAALPKSMQAVLTVDFQDLKPLEPVTCQFESRGLVFEDAIALIPSNPRFICRSGQSVLMPAHPDNTLAIEPQPMVQRLYLCGRGTQPIVVKTWDADGNLQSTQTADLPQLDSPLLPCQILKLSTEGIHRIELSSAAPFTLEGVAL